MRCYPANARPRLGHQQVNRPQCDCPSGRSGPSGKDRAPLLLRSQHPDLRKSRQASCAHGLQGHRAESAPSTSTDNHTIFDSSNASRGSGFRQQSPDLNGAMRLLITATWPRCLPPRRKRARQTKVSPDDINSAPMPRSESRDEHVKIKSGTSLPKRYSQVVREEVD